MSRVAPPTGEPVEATPRRSMTPVRRFRIWDAYGGKCGMCRTMLLLHGSGMEIDHIIPIELSGPDSDDNCWPLCAPCHRIKTKKDKKDIAKARRLRNKSTGEKQPSRIASKGFDKTRSRRFDGSVVRKDEK